MLLELIGSNLKPVILNTDLIVRIVHDTTDPSQYTYIVMQKGDNYKVSHTYEELASLLSVKQPFKDKLDALSLAETIANNPTTAVIDVESSPSPRIGAGRDARQEYERIMSEPRSAVSPSDWNFTYVPPQIRR
jgi:hypothetical protein